MYGVPDNADWSFLADRELLQVCVGLYQVSLKFDGDTSIDVECEFDHSRSNTMSPPAAGLPGRAATLFSLLGVKIASVARQDGRTLAIAFRNDETLKIYDSNESFESFQIVGAGRQIVV
jgi:Family of unknown function (DUF6188)